MLRRIHHTLLASAALALGCATSPPPRGSSVTHTAESLRFTRVLRASGLAPSAPLAARAERLAEVFRARGGRPTSERWTAFLRQDSSATATVEVAAGRCLGFAAVAREGIEDLNLSVANGAGSAIASDTRGDAHPYAGRVCADTASTWFVSMTARTGNGEATLVTIADPPSVAPALAQALGDREVASLSGPRVQRAVMGRDPAVLPASEFLSRVTERMSARGYRTAGPMQSGTLRAGRASARLQLDAGRCYAVLGVGGDGVEQMDMQVGGAERGMFGEASGRDSPAAVRLCAPSSGTIEVSLSTNARARSGSWAVGLFEITARPELGADVTGAERARVSELWMDAAQRGMVPLGEAVRARASAAGEVSASLVLRAGRCYLVGAALSDGEGPGVVDLWLSGRTGALLGADTLERERAEVFYCARATERARVSVRGQGLRRTWVMQAFESRESP